MSREIASGLPKAPREAILAALDGRKMADLACEAGIDAQAAHNRLNAGLRMARARLNALGIRSADDVVGESRSVLAMSPAAAPDRFKSDTQRQSEWMQRELLARGLEETPGVVQALAAQWRLYHPRIDKTGEFREDNASHEID